MYAPQVNSHIFLNWKLFQTQMGPKWSPIIKQQCLQVVVSSIYKNLPEVNNSIQILLIVSKIKAFYTKKKSTNK